MGGNEGHEVMFYVWKYCEIYVMPMADLEIMTVMPYMENKKIPSTAAAETLRKAKGRDSVHIYLTFE